VECLHSFVIRIATHKESRFDPEQFVRDRLKDYSCARESCDRARQQRDPEVVSDDLHGVHEGAHLSQVGPRAGTVDVLNDPIVETRVRKSGWEEEHFSVHFSGIDGGLLRQPMVFRNAQAKRLPADRLAPEVFIEARLDAKCEVQLPTQDCVDKLESRTALKANAGFDQRWLRNARSLVIGGRGQIQLLKNRDQSAMSISGIADSQRPLLNPVVIANQIAGSLHMGDGLLDLTKKEDPRICDSKSPAITLEDFGVQITFKAIDTAGEDGWVYTERTSGLVEAPGLGSKDDELLSSEWNIYFLICVHASFLH
jgi:hypothetical protein